MSVFSDTRVEIKNRYDASMLKLAQMGMTTDIQAMGLCCYNLLSAWGTMRLLGESPDGACPNISVVSLAATHLRTVGFAAAVELARHISRGLDFIRTKPPGETAGMALAIEEELAGLLLCSLAFRAYDITALEAISKTLPPVNSSDQHALRIVRKTDDVERDVVDLINNVITLSLRFYSVPEHGSSFHAIRDRVVTLDDIALEFRSRVPAWLTRI